ncbi:MAG: porin [Candidatus Hydrogenedentota bacterium]
MRIDRMIFVALCALIGFTTPSFAQVDEKAASAQADISAEIAGHSLSKVHRWLHEIALPKIDPETGLYFARGLWNYRDTAADNTKLDGAEVAYVRGPFSAQSEYILVDIDALSGSKDTTFDAYYLMGSYFITGEHRRYKLGSGVFDKIRPKRNFGFGEDGGPGAWELLIRYSQIDLEDSGYTGGELTDLTLGVNWYLNPNMKVMLNYIHGELEDGLLGVGEEEDIDYIMTRF